MAPRLSPVKCIASWGANFRLVGDTANGGLAVKAPVIAGGGSTTSYRPFINLDVQTQMNGVNATAYIRELIV